MIRLLQLSFLVFAILVPMLASRDRSPVRGVRRTALFFFMTTVVYATLIAFVFPRFA